MKIFDQGLDTFLDNVSETVQWIFDGAEEIGTSDISCCVLSILRGYYSDPKAEAAEMKFTLTRNAVSNSL